MLFRRHAEDPLRRRILVVNEHTYHITNVEENGAIPAVETPSWLGDNTYRANTKGDLVIRAPDLTARAAPVDASRCGEGILRVCAEVTNRGDVVAGPGLDVTFYDGDPAAGGVPIGTAETTTRLGPGDSETVCVDWAAAPRDAVELWISVDTGAEARECVEDNNVVDLGPGRCEQIQ